MASKFQRQQKRKRWSDAGTEFSPAFLIKVAAVAGDTVIQGPTKHLAGELQRLAELKATYAELESIPGICAGITAQSGTAASDPVHDCITFSLLADLLFLGNSRPIHRQLLNCMRHLPPERCAIWHNIIMQELLAAIELANSSKPYVEDLPLRLSDAIFSLLEHKPLHQKLRECAGEAALYLARGLSAVCRQSVNLGAAQPSHLEDVQDSVGSCYIILQLYGGVLAADGHDQGHRAIVEIASAMLLGLQGNVLPREGLSSAAVTLWTAASLPDVPLPALALPFAQSLMLPDGLRMSILQLQGGAGEPGLVQTHLAQQGTSLAAELRALSTMARVCALKGIASILPDAVLLAPFTIENTADAAMAPALATGESEGCRRRWSLLIDGGLPMICSAVEKAMDTHLQHQAFAALTIILQRLAGYLREAVAQSGERSVESSQAFLPVDMAEGNCASGAGGDSSEPAAAVDAKRPVTCLDAASRTRVTAVLQQHFETALPQTMKQVNYAFETLLDILVCQHQHAAALGIPLSAEPEQAKVLTSIAMQLLALGKFRKGRYYPLRAVVQRLGALWLLDLQPQLVTSTLEAMEREPLCNTASNFLEVFLRRLRRELTAAGSEDVSSRERWREAWVQPLLQALLAGGERLRSNVSTYCVPLLLGMDGGSLPHLLRSLLGGCNNDAAAMDDNKIAALVAILKAARQLQLVDDLREVQCPGEEPVSIPEGLIVRAISHTSEALRVDAMHLVCVHPKITLLPGELELKLVARGLSLGMRCSSTNLRNKWTSLLGKLLRRVVVSLRAAVIRRKAGTGSLTASADLTPEALDDERGMQRQASFLCWLSRTLQASLYPGAPFERKYFALIVLNQLLDAWGATDSTPPPRGAKGKTRTSDSQASFESSYAGLQVFCPGFLGAPGVTALLEATMDTWDRVREGTVTALSKLPTPLPGFEHPSQAASLATWAQALMASARVADADAGARLMRLVFQKYVLGLKWDLWPSASEPAQGQPERSTLLPACMSFLQRLTDKLQAEVELGEQDLAAATRGSLAHGSLLCLRYVLADVPWASLAAGVAGGEADQPAALDDSELARWLDSLVGLVGRVVDITLPCLTQPQETAIGAEDVSGTDVVLEDDWDAGEASSADEDAPQSPAGQLIVTACWLSLKEAALVLGTLARHAPLTGLFAGKGSGGVLRTSHMADMGALFVCVLTTMKHNGATEKCQAGFLSLTERVLREPSAELQRLPREWLSILMRFICRPGQTLTDINRRSAGVPYAFVALFLPESPGSHKVLLQAGLDELMRIANDSALQLPFPRVHAFNVLRLAFLDSELAIDTSAYFAEGMRSAILAMSAPHWEVRNAASLAYTSLLVRTLGFKNAQGGSAGAAALSGAEFFQRYPLLHAFFLEQLEMAADQLEAGCIAVHPSLFPVLVLLSRLRSSDQTPEGHNASLSPAAFAPVIQRCLRARPMGVRQRAALAMAPLVAPAELLAVTLGLVRRISAQQPIKDHNEVHGLLLQLRALLEINWAEADATNSLASIAAPMLGVLQLAGATPCAPVAVECLQVVGILLSLLPPAPSVGVDGSLGESLLSVPASSQQAHSVVLLQNTHNDRLAYGAASSPEHSRGQLVSATRTLCRGLTSNSRPAGMMNEGLTSQHRDTQSAELPGMERLSVRSPAGRADYKEPQTDAHSPMRSVLLRTAAQLLLGPLCHPVDGSVRSDDGATLRGDVELVLGHRSPEVRIAALKALLERASAGAPGTAAQLADVLRDHRVREHDPRALSLNHHLTALLLQPSQGSPRTSGLLAAKPLNNGLELAGLGKPGAEWGSLRATLSGSHDPDEREGALRGLGAAARQVVRNVQQGAASMEETLDDFLGDLSACSSSSETMPMRLAAQRALHDSGLLPCLCGSGAGKEMPALRQAAMQSWILALRMMEDEEVLVRAGAASSAGTALLELEGTDARLAVVELVERQAMRLLARRCCDMPAFHHQLLNWIYRPSDRGSSGRGLGGKQQQRLYQKEKDNQHEEGLLFAQMAAQELQQLLKADRPASLLQAVQQWAASLGQDLAWMAAQLKDCPPEPRSLAGPTYSAATFLPLFCCLTGLAVAASLPLAQQIAPGIQNALQAVAREIDPERCHTLLGSVLGVCRAAWRAPESSREGGLVDENERIELKDEGFGLFGLVQDWTNAPS